jgi:hypothetical protein
LTRWLTALGVTHSSSAVCVTLRRRASASKVSRHWMGGIRRAALLLKKACGGVVTGSCGGFEAGETMGRVSAEHHGLGAVEDHAVLAVPLHGTGQHLAFGVAAAGGQVFHGVGVVGAGHVLLDDRAFVQVAVT